MTILELAATIPAPVEQGRRVRAYVAHVGDGFQAYFGLDGGRGRQLIGPIFERPRKACALVRLLNQPIDPAPRSAPVIPTDLPIGADEETSSRTQEPTGAPEKSLTPADVSGVGSTPNAEGAGSIPALRSTPRPCAGCGELLPPGARRNQRTHGPACRQAASRNRRPARAAGEPGEDADSGTRVVTLSGGSEGLRPGVVVARHVNDVIAANNPAARPDTRERPGAEPSGVTRNRSADAPRATSSDGGSPETERAIANVATPGRSQSTPDPDPRVAQDRGSSARPGLRPTPDPTSLTLGLAER